MKNMLRKKDHINSESVNPFLKQTTITRRYFRSTHFHCAPETFHLKCCALDRVINSLICTILNVTIRSL